MNFFNVFFYGTTKNQPILGANNETMRLVNTLREGVMRVQAQQALNEANFAFNQALTNLRNIRNAQMPQPHVANILTEGIDNLIKEVDDLKRKGKEPIDCLTKALEATAARLNGTMTEAQYENIAKKMQGHASPGIRILGAALMLVGVPIALCCLLVFPIPLIYVIPIFASMLAGCYMTLSSDQGLAKKMNELNTKIERDAQIQPRTNRQGLPPSYTEATTTSPNSTSQEDFPPLYDLPPPYTQF